MKKSFKEILQPGESQDKLPTERAVRWDLLCMLEMFVAIG